MDYKNTFTGDCHCGNISFELYTNKDESDFTPRTCQCSLCKKHGASWISDPEGKLALQHSESISSYRFGHSTSDFIVCSKCGVLTIATCETENRLRAVINIKSMQNHTFPSEEILTNFDDENVEQRLARRTKNWTGNVTIGAA